MSLTPELEAAIAKLAKVTVEHNLDPGKVIVSLMKLTEWLNSLTPEQRAAVRRELRRRRRGRQ